MIFVQLVAALQRLAATPLLLALPHLANAGALAANADGAEGAHGGRALGHQRGRARAAALLARGLQGPPPSWPAAFMAGGLGLPLGVLGLGGRRLLLVAVGLVAWGCRSAGVRPSRIGRDASLSREAE